MKWHLGDLVVLKLIDEVMLSTCTIEVDFGCIEVGGICQGFSIVKRYGDDSVVFTRDRFEIWAEVDGDGFVCAVKWLIA